MASASDKLNLQEGTQLVQHARAAIVDALAARAPAGPILSAPAGRSSRLAPLPSTGVFAKTFGLFITLSTHPDGKLRGCRGQPEGDRPLGQLVSRAAVQTALHDSRFEPLEAGELQNLVVEASVLTPPKRIMSTDPAKRLAAVRPGHDGIIIEYGPAAGLLLPQVAVEWNLGAAQFLDLLCQKAGLPPGMWKSASAKLYLFQAQIFTEKHPGGPIKAVKLVL